MNSNRQGGLAATKLCPPEPPGRLVHRPNLFERLDAAIDDGTALLLVSAPAGSGKTTLLAAWLAGRSESWAWFQVEESDSDPTQFWTCFVEAIDRVQPGAAERLRPIVTASAGDDDSVVPAVVNYLTDCETPLVVVIDDYHLLDNPEVHRGVERLIELRPMSATIVVSTRLDPPFRIGRMRVRGLMSEIRGEDLRLQKHEAPALLGPAADSLDDSRLEILWRRTEGWAAGLVLAGISLQRVTDRGAFVAAFGGHDQLVVDYLHEEFLAGADPQERERYLETSILDRFSGPLVDALTGTTGSGEWLRETAKGNQLLNRLDGSGTWYRYHRLLRDLLRLEAARSIPHRLPALHINAAEWFESQGDLGQAVAHRLASGDNHEAARVLGMHGPRLLAAGQHHNLRRLLEQTEDAASTSAWCALLHGWCDFVDGHYTRSDQWLDTVLEIAGDDFDRDLITAPRMNNALGRGDVAAALDIARQGANPDQLTAQSCTLAAVTGATYAWAGRSADARRVLRLATEKAIAEEVPAVHAKTLVVATIVAFEDGSPTAAAAAASTAIATAESFGLATYHGIAPAYAIRAKTSKDPARSRSDVSHAVHSVKRTSTELERGYVLALCGDALLDLGDSDGTRLVTEARSVLDQLTDPGVAGMRLATAETRHANVKHRHIDASDLADQLTEREMEVLRYLPTRMSQTEIASELYVSINTVKTHCRAIYRKLAVRDRQAAIQAARHTGLL